MKATRNHTPKAMIEQERKVNPATLERVATVYGESLYIPKDRRPNAMIPIYRSYGEPVLTLCEGHGERWWRQEYLHPDNILTPHTPPMSGDYLQLLHEGRPSENHTEIFITAGTLGDGLYLIEDMHGETYACARNEAFDTQKCRGWVEVSTTTA